MTRDEPHHAADRARHVRDVFAAVARRYDLLNHLLSAGLDHRWRQRAAAAAVPSRDRHNALADKPPVAPARRSGERRPPGPLVVDVCTGTGDLAMAVLRREPTARVVACDFCRGMIERARRKVERAGLLRRATLLETDALALPLPDASADAATCAFGLRNLADPSPGLAEMARVVRPGGRVVVLEFHHPRRQGALAGLFSLYFRHILPRVGGWISRDRRGGYEYLVTSIEAFGPPEHTAQALRETGLEAVRIEPLAGGIASVYAGRKPC